MASYLRNVGLSLGISVSILACESRRASEAARNNPPKADVNVSRLEFSDTVIQATHRSPATLKGEALISKPAEFPLKHGPGTITIGELDGNSNEVFGRIRSVETDDQGNVFVLDEQALQLSWFGPDGSYRGRIGRGGRGPGEFRVPRSVAVDDSGYIYISDSLLRRISVFAIADSSLVHLRDISVDFTPHSLCAMNGRLFVVSPAESLMVRVLRSTGETDRRFGERIVDLEAKEWALVSDSDVMRRYVQRYVSEARIVCAHNHQRIVLVGTSTPLTRSFSLSGQELWQAKIPDFQRATLTPGQRPGFVSWGHNKKTGSITVTAGTALYGSTLVVTTREYSLRDWSGTLTTHWISLANGRELEKSSTDRIYTAFDANRAYSYINEPYPQIFINHIARQRDL